MDFEPPAYDEVGKLIGNGAVANPMEVSPQRTEEGPFPSQSPSSSDEVDGDDLEDLNVEQLKVLMFKPKGVIDHRSSAQQVSTAVTIGRLRTAVLAP